MATKKQKSKSDGKKLKKKKSKSKAADSKSTTEQPQPQSKVQKSAVNIGDTVKPRLIAFEVTRQCKFNCKHCRANAENNPDVAELSTDQCRKILASVSEFCKPVIIMTGGEPLERGDIYELIEYGRGLGMRMVLATCGYLINKESLAKLKKVGVLALSISLDGASAHTHDTLRQTTGAFDAAIEAAKAAKRAGMKFQINTTISRLNIEEIRGIVELTKGLGAYCFNAFVLVPTGRGREMADEVLDPMEYEVLLNELLLLKLESSIEVRVTCAPSFVRVCDVEKARRVVKDVKGCLGGRTFGFIGYRGDVQTCGFLDISAGNMIENGYDFGHIWRRSEFLNEIRDVSNYKENCGICKYAETCGGCRARAYAVGGDYLGPDTICRFARSNA